MAEELLPPLYKYLNVNGANLTLTNRTFRHAKPSDFNDLEDMTVMRLFPEDELESLRIQNDNFTDAICRNLNKKPTCQNIEMRVKIALLQTVFQNNPDAIRIVKETKENDELSKIYDLERLRKVNASTLKEINEFLQGYRVLCLSQRNDCPRMWQSYAENNQGIALRVTPNLEKDSKFKLCRPVRYKETRPPLFPSTIEFLENSLFGDPDAFHARIIDNIIYTKTKAWEYENEYRLAIPIRPLENWNTLPYHPEEISELYLGLKTSDVDRKKFVDLARQINPKIKVFCAAEVAEEKMMFTPL